MSVVFESWRRSPALHELRSPATDDDLAAAMEGLARALPSEMAELYRFSNGMAALGGNLAIEPLEEMVGFSGRLRTWDWPIPDEVVVFGGNGV